MTERRDPAPFDLTADLYSQVRPGYPEALVDFVVERAGLTPGARLLELGCGPGLATLPFALQGVDIVALDQSDHVTLPPDVRRRCLAAVRERIAELGGIVERDHESVAMIARPL